MDPSEVASVSRQVVPGVLLMPDSATQPGNEPGKDCDYSVKSGIKCQQQQQNRVTM